MDHTQLSEFELKKLELLERIDSLSSVHDHTNNSKEISELTSTTDTSNEILDKFANTDIQNESNDTLNDESLKNITIDTDPSKDELLHINHDNNIKIVFDEAIIMEKESEDQDTPSQLHENSTIINVNEDIEMRNIEINTNNDDVVLQDNVDISNLAENIQTETNNLNENENENIVITWDYNKEPKCLTHATKVFSSKTNNFIKGCKWSPDGTCLLTNSDDNYLRLFNTPYQLYQGQLTDIEEMTPEFKIFECSTIYDYCWSPLMNSNDPSTCFLISSAKSSPVHMWDAFSGKLVSSYRSFDAMVYSLTIDEPTAAYSVCFTLDGCRIIAGFDGEFRIFDTTRPGRDSEIRKTHCKKIPGQNGLLSCIDASSTDLDLIAVGSYLKSVCLYDLRVKGMQAMFNGQVGGVTQVKFSTDGTRLYSGGRKDSEIICWDLRNYGRVLYTMKREVSTNQRMYFDIDSTQNTLASASSDGMVKLWDLSRNTDVEDEEPLLSELNSWIASTDCVNGVSCHPFMPVIATCSGQRHVQQVDYDSSDCDSMNSECSAKSFVQENSLKLWYCGN